ncbi:histidine triad nucleotide-binding protein [Geothermobacter hydrogeniphilus]|uniref:Histidine triad nucleotide-binding protein n=1 Tax=Geothermobacter hydrogeniphilus TaxID=1969733 RepID=A0A2K2HCS8_9BACT|nr:histidine triad nucleotide-binding protein [Geothermobacter hydrogeniphilus]PNU21090.1 histidine triad nucleotide-binding protein [Geothermobacter hydrogeniphilus]
MPDNCIFCKIIAGEIPGNFVYQDEEIVVVEDIAPQAPHHYLLLPKKHIPTTLDLDLEDRELVGHIHRVAARIAREKGFADEGFRIVNNCNESGGQVVWHLHFHLLGGRRMGWPPG